jgi:GMP synthase-like glutamine amidotransferase
MRIFFLQHDPLDGPGAMIEWAEARGHTVATCLICEGAPLPPIESFDLLVSLGGPMGAYEEDLLPWLGIEKQYLRQTVAAGKKILGLCLGCQLLAEALGGKAFRHTCKEFGWQPIEPLPQGADWFGTQKPFKAFQWHGDTYSLPPEAVQIATNEACDQQAFVIGNQVLGLQFHLEWTEQMARDALADPGAAPPKSPFVQSPEEILSDPSLFETGKRRFFLMMDRFVS